METFTEPSPRGPRMKEAAAAVEGRGGDRAAGWMEHFRLGTETHLPGQLWTQLPNPLSTSEISPTVFTGLPCPWLAICEALQQTCESSKDSL